MAVGDNVQFENNGLAVSADPPLRGIVQVAGPPEEILWENGARSDVDSRGAGAIELLTITPASIGDLGLWINRRVQLNGPAAAFNGGDQARGVVVSLYNALGDLRAVVRRNVDGLYYQTVIANLTRV